MDCCIRDQLNTIQQRGEKCAHVWESVQAVDLSIHGRDECALMCFLELCTVYLLNIDKYFYCSKSTSGISFLLQYGVAPFTRA